MSTTSHVGEVADPQVLRDWLLEHVDLPHAGDEPIELDLISGGVSNVTIGVSLGPHELVVRRPPPTSFLPTANDVGREYRFYAALDATDVPTPQVLAFCDDVEIIGAPFYVMERLQGEVPHDETVLSGMTAAEGRVLSERFVDLLAEIHAIDIDEVGLVDIARPEGYLERQVRRWTDQWHRSKEADDPAIDELARVLGTAIPTSPPTTVVHGDYRLGNVMVDAADRTRIVGILDWEMATLGDPLADLGYSLLYWGTRDRPFVHPSQACADLPGFLTAPELTDRYATATGQAVNDITFYVVLAAFKLAIIGEGNRARSRRAGKSGPSYPTEIPGPRLPDWALDLWNTHNR
jgi:aminoglycoside phosphotransferase (APT) family kinase protein